MQSIKFKAQIQRFNLVDSIEKETWSDSYQCLPDENEKKKSAKKKKKYRAHTYSMKSSFRN